MTKQIGVLPDNTGGDFATQPTLFLGMVFTDDQGRYLRCTCIGDRSLCRDRADCPHKDGNLCKPVPSVPEK